MRRHSKLPGSVSLSDAIGRLHFPRLLTCPSTNPGTSSLIPVHPGSDKKRGGQTPSNESWYILSNPGTSWSYILVQTRNGAASHQGRILVNPGRTSMLRQRPVLHTDLTTILNPPSPSDASHPPPSPRPPLGAGGSSRSSPCRRGCGRWRAWPAAPFLRRRWKGRWW